MQGFGFTYDVKLGILRNWYVDKDGIKRWVDNDLPVKPSTPQSQENESNKEK
jgi:hypothetical protein